MAKVLKTPGVYIEEKNAFPSSIVPVATAVPAFIGYTERAERNGKSLLLKPSRISSFGEYRQLFGGAPLTKLTVLASEHSESLYELAIKESYFTLHSQLKMFFANGGSDCYIVSVGGYAKEDGSPNVISLETLETGIAPLLKEPEPTMLVVPEAVHAPVDPINTDDDVKAIGILYQKMLKHCGVDTQNRFAITDVWMNPAFASPAYNMRDDLDRYRESVGTNNLMWGAAYFPWLHTTAVELSEVSFRNIDNLGDAGDVKNFPEGTFDEGGKIIDETRFKTDFVDGKPDTLLGMLDQALNQEVLDGTQKAGTAAQIKETIFTPLAEVDTSKAEAVDQANSGLLAVSPLYKAILHDLRKRLNLLPPSAAMAGIYSMIDNQEGVFQSPANVSVGSVTSPAVSIGNDQQENMNVPINGKAVNAIRAFPGRGVLVWGARTLDGNSQDWRYVNVRRTVIFIEQSIKVGIKAYVFEPNTAATWSTVKAMISNFLTNVWQSGGLAGATPADAFSVDVGLGTTMTPTDILDGRMRIEVKVAVTRPAEFIVITFEQQMQQS